MKKILILGCGYVGSALGKTLHEKGYKVFTTTRTEEKVAGLSDFSHKVHLTKELDYATLVQLCSGMDAIFLTVAPTYKTQNLAESYHQTYLCTATALVQALNDLQASCQLVYTSSTSVYNGFREQKRIVTEDLTLSPATEEAKILLETERVLQKYSKTCIFRLSEVLGPGREMHQRLANVRAPLPGSGENIANMVDVRDIVKALLLCLNKRLFGIYNICNDEHPVRKDLYETICHRHNLPKMTWDPSRPSRHGGLYVISNQKIKKEGMVFDYSLL